MTAFVKAPTALWKGSPECTEHQCTQRLLQYQIASLQWPMDMECRSRRLTSSPTDLRDFVWRNQMCCFAPSERLRVKVMITQVPKHKNCSLNYHNGTRLNLHSFLLQTLPSQLQSAEINIFSLILYWKMKSEQGNILWQINRVVFFLTITSKFRKSYTRQWPEPALWETRWIVSVIQKPTIVSPSKHQI